MARAEGARRDSLAREERLRAEREQRIQAARATLLEPIYFDYDRADLSDESKSGLQAKLPILTNSPDVKLRITGHADERGSDEYNLALGQSRAATALRYLVDHGIDRSRLDLTSYGEERPVCTEPNEGRWSRNRRAGFELIAGAERIVAY
jgi:peptidoglycan-associated lipoprotein